MHDNPEMMEHMQPHIMAAAGRAGVDGETMTRNMQNQLMTGAGAGPMGMMGALPGLMSRFGGGRGGGHGRGRGGGGGRGRGGGPGAMMGGFGGMMGLPAGMLGGRPGGPLGFPEAGQRGTDSGLRPPPMCGPMDAGSRMGSGGMCGMRRPPDVMQPPMGAATSSTADTASSVPTSTTARTDLLSGQPGGMVGNLATTPGSVILGLPQPKKSDDEPAPAEVPEPLPPPCSGPPPPTSKKAEPLPQPRMLDDDEDQALLRGRGTLPPPSSVDQDALSSERPAAVAAERPSDPAPSRTESRSRAGNESDERRVTVVEEAAGGESCTACEAGGLQFGAGKKCPHAFCVSCIQSYFSHGETECPVCGIRDETSGRTLTQPASGHMLTTYENGFKLPGFETTSRGTIIVTYSFPAGIQTVSHNFTIGYCSSVIKPPLATAREA